ncbi:MAG: pro-sigmaK processing inhibitor BofA family protein [Candidatus Onthomonas sp.]|nr:pro-sigmaK processing inhibitor BofA family protein [Candidatus Onthomonas sp.]
MSTETQVLWGLGVFGGLLVLVLLRRVVAAVVKLVLRTAVGAGVLTALSYVGGAIGLNLGVNLGNALVLGVLGAPGLGLLMMLNWLVRSG